MGERQIWITDFGSQYTQLITRKCRELGHSSEIMTVEDTISKLESGKRPKAIILSGGPDSVSSDKFDYSTIFNSDLPLLGICYGMQLMAKYYDGKVEKGELGEYGHTKIRNVGEFSIEGVPSEVNVWMSHFDHITETPSGFSVIMESQHGVMAAIKHDERPLMGMQFHPEVAHSEYGEEFLSYFIGDIAKLDKDWGAEAILTEAENLVRSIGDTPVLCAFSGGVDSLVAATLSQRILGKNLYCFFVDHGLLRPQDYGHIKTLQEETDLNIEIIDAKEDFMVKCDGVKDPEEKRKNIGHTFIEVFEKKVHEFENNHNIHFTHLLQGTLYPDVIESISPHKKGGKSAVIKSHHNVGGLPERMKLKLLEPLRFLFKDEVRGMGESLGLKRDWVQRHPFPGPGIGIRILGELSRESIRKVQESDQILYEELINWNLYDSTAQAFTVLLPIKTVGVKGDGRSYEEVICLRMVSTTDFMTAVWSDVPREFLSKVSNRITNEVSGITRVVYDITSKPPGTIEWE